MGKEYKYMGYRRLPSNVMAKLNEMSMNNIEAFKDPNTPNVQESVSYSHRAPEGKGGSPMTLCLVRSPCSSLLTPAILLSVLFGAYLLRRFLSARRRKPKQSILPLWDDEVTF